MQIQKKIPDVFSRALKTFFQSFGGVLIPEVCLILSKVTDYDWKQWYVWVTPIVCGALAAGISAVWNGIINATSKEEVK